MGTKTFFLRPGQALMELAVGMLAIALVASATFAFIEYSVISLDIQRSLRAKAGVAAMGSQGGSEAYSSSSDSGVVTIEPLAAEYIFSSREVKVKEEVHMPVMGGLLNSK